MRASSNCVAIPPHSHLHSVLVIIRAVSCGLARVSADDEKQLLVLLLTNAFTLAQLRLAVTSPPSLRPASPRADADASSPPRDYAAPPSAYTDPPAPSVHTTPRHYFLVDARAVATIRLLDLLQHVKTVQETLVLVHQLCDLNVFLHSTRRNNATSRSAIIAFVDRCASFC